jgi:small subunit ribosomal protein S35
MLISRIFSELKVLTSVPVRHYNPAERLPLTEHQKKIYPQVEQELTDEGFPILKFKPRRGSIFNDRPKRITRRRSRFIAYNREECMKEDQDWPSIWPTAKTFVPSAVPLPLRQSYESKPGSVPVGKYANTELLKISNFLHLTPDAIKRHCLALKKFCSAWPSGLDTDEQIRAHFPVTFISSDYVHASSNIRDPRSRIVRLQVYVDDLKLNKEDRRKLVELARHRYDAKSGLLSITADACPTRTQNQDYAEYLLSAVYYESQEHQDWEKEYTDEEAIYRVNLDEYRQSVEHKLGLK